VTTIAEVTSTNGMVNYFDPSLEQTNTRLASGVYPANIIKCDKVTRPVKNKYQADIYNFKVKVHDTVATKTYQIEDIDGSMKNIGGRDYVGREIRSVGIFFFLTPDLGDGFEAHPGGNRKYMEVVEALGINCPEIEVDVDGGKKMVKSLPHLETSDFLGIPVHATVGLGKPWKGSDGVERRSFEVKSINKWEDGVKIDVELEELPF
jgi:hypothetical protein